MINMTFTVILLLFYLNKYIEFIQLFHNSYETGERNYE